MPNWQWITFLKNPFLCHLLRQVAWLWSLLVCVSAHLASIVQSQLEVWGDTELSCSKGMDLELWFAPAPRGLTEWVGGQGLREAQEGAKQKHR